MPVTDVPHDLDSRTLTSTVHFAAPVTRVWQVYADPRRLEKVWGPPTHPATVVDHDLAPGGRVTYFMTGPEGQKYAGYWTVTAFDEPRSRHPRRLHEQLLLGRGTPACAGHWMIEGATSAMAQIDDLLAA